MLQLLIISLIALYGTFFVLTKLWANDTPDNESNKTKHSQQKNLNPNETRKQKQKERLRNLAIEKSDRLPWFPYIIYKLQNDNI